MLIYFADGQLGNQLFQYSFLRSIQKKEELIISSGFEVLDQYFNHNYFINLNKQNRYLRYVIYEIIQKLLIFLSDIRVISQGCVVMEKVNGISRESTEYIIEKGLFSSITFVKLGYFQSEKFIDKNKIRKLKLKKEYIKAGLNYLNQIPKNTYPVFLHVRLRDYRMYKVGGKSVVLPMSYYKDCINWYINNKKNPYFIVMSDEPKVVQNWFKDVKNLIISHEKNSGIDMGIMSKCKGAILSASSFSWWGSYFMDNKDVVIAPKHWLGFNIGIDYYKGSIPSYAITRQVN